VLLLVLLLWGLAVAAAGSPKLDVEMLAQHVGPQQGRGGHQHHAEPVRGTCCMQQQTGVPAEVGQ
jgi:hypothetical protein